VQHAFNGSDYLFNARLNLLFVITAAKLVRGRTAALALLL
jgi:hypothetical protein